MKIEAVYSVAFSPTDNTEIVTKRIAKKLADFFDVPFHEIPWTLPEERAGIQNFAPTDLVIAGGPTYAGKLPNKILPDYQNNLKGNETPAVSVVTFGNRSFDNSLAELCSVLESSGFRTVAGGAFAGTHAFSDALATGRPNTSDLEEIDDFAVKIFGKIQAAESLPHSIQVKGDAAAPYYIPKGTDGQPAKFLKAKPQTNMDLCVKCGLCARLCPMGSINLQDPAEVTGICIKCQRCVRKCPHDAKYFDDEAFLSHVQMLEENFQRKAENYTVV